MILGLSTWLAHFVSLADIWGFCCYLLFVSSRQCLLLLCCEQLSPSFQPYGLDTQEGRALPHGHGGKGESINQNWKGGDIPPLIFLVVGCKLCDTTLPPLREIELNLLEWKFAASLVLPDEYLYLVKQQKKAPVKNRWGSRLDRNRSKVWEKGSSRCGRIFGVQLHWNLSLETSEALDLKGRDIYCN